MRISVDGSRIRNNKVAFSNLSGGLSMCISREGDWSERAIFITGHFFFVVFLQVSVKSTPEGL